MLQKVGPEMRSAKMPSAEMPSAEMPIVLFISRRFSLMKKKLLNLLSNQFLKN